MALTTTVPVLGPPHHAAYIDRVFGTDTSELERRLAAVEGRLARIDAMTAQAAPLLADAAHVQHLAEEARSLSEAVRVTVAGASEAAKTVVKPRFTPRFNEVYRSEGFGYVCVYFAGGRTGTVRILVGIEDPPTELAVEVAFESPNYGAAVIRPGEFWTLSCRRADGGGFKAQFTPLF
jgi:hypothetical protein